MIKKRDKKKKWLEKKFTVDIYGRELNLSDVPMTIMSRKQIFEKRNYSKKIIQTLWDSEKRKKMINKQDIIFDEISNEVYLYLEELRESGLTNMFGAVPYIEDSFQVNKSLAKKLLNTWMENYDTQRDKKEKK
tara:strand:- start:256 stop:654 length:399 start_codon:yes stop_codon:yes gene_type:complete